MPPGNHFAHQTYSDQVPTAPHRLMQAGPSPPVDSAEFTERMHRVSAAFRQSGVAAIYLIHGTFVGRDIFGLVEALARVMPGAADLLDRAAKQSVDAALGEIGNYTQEYARRFQQSLDLPGQEPIPVRRFVWSGENHHLGRADTAVRLLDELASCAPASDRRILLWGHSHAGNVLALVTNLLGSNRRSRARFFRAARPFYRWPLSRHVDAVRWPALRDLLRNSQHPLASVPLDLVTFGTPVRYGWDTLGYAKLLHVVNHRPQPGLPPHRASFPPTTDDVLHAAAGDCIQQLGIAGTNIPPNWLLARTWLADRRLGRLLQPGLRRRDLLARLRLGTRVHHEGTTLLVDYGPQPGSIKDHLSGHAVYTCEDQLLFHAEGVAREFYALGAGLPTSPLR